MTSMSPGFAVGSADSSGEEYSIISVQRLDDLIVPRFFWFDFPKAKLDSDY
jgi:hypothetical protein